MTHSEYEDLYRLCARRDPSGIEEMVNTKTATRNGMSSQISAPLSAQFGLRACLSATTNCAQSLKNKHLTTASP